MTEDTMTPTAPRAATPPGRLPVLTQARAPLTQSIEVVNEFGTVSTTAIPAERDLTVYVDKRELKCACVGGDSNVPGIWGASLFMFLVVSMLNTYGLGAGVRLIMTGTIIITVILLANGEDADLWDVAAEVEAAVD